MGDIQLRYISSPDEYVQFVASATLPDNFVYYADISELGAFVSFVCEMGTINNYTYGIMDESGTELTLYIDPIKNDNQILAESTLNASDINSSSMKTLKNENGGGAYSYNGILYKYRNGRLSSIVWQNDGFQYTLANTITPREGFQRYNSSMAHTAVGKLLNLSTAAEAVAAISAPTVSK